MARAKAVIKRGPGRPCIYDVSPTAWGRWLDERSIPVSGFIATMKASAVALGYLADAVPAHTSLRCVKNGTRQPSPLTMLLIRHATGGAIDLQHWAPTPAQVEAEMMELLAGKPRFMGLHGGRAEP